MHFHRVAIRLDEPTECLLVARLRGGQQKALIGSSSGFAHRWSAFQTVPASETNRGPVVRFRANPDREPVEPHPHGPGRLSIAPLLPGRQRCLGQSSSRLGSVTERQVAIQLEATPVTIEQQAQRALIAEACGVEQRLLVGFISAGGARTGHLLVKRSGSRNLIGIPANDMPPHGLRGPSAAAD
jgi:hypothetical protein